MVDPRPSSLAAAHARAVVAHHRGVLGAALAVLLVSTAVAATLRLDTDFADLLPDDEPAVAAMRRLGARRPATAVLEIGVASVEPEATRRFATVLASAIRTHVPARLVGDVEEDDRELRAFVARWRLLYAAEDDLARARDAVAARLNPLIVDLETGGAVAGLAARLRAAADPGDGFVGEKGRLRMLVLRCPWGDTDVARAREALARIAAAVAVVRAGWHGVPVEVGWAGAPVTATLEHDRVAGDLARSAALCLGLVALALVVALGDLRAAFALVAALVVGTVATFALARLLVGHLNLSTAFLGSVVAGNGVNFGIVVVARYLEARRGGEAHEAATVRALAGSGRPTLVAALAAAVSYASLIVSGFHGFDEFGVIAATGMALCWLAAVTVLPALLTFLDGRGLLVVAPRPPTTPRLFARLGRCAVPVALVLAALGVVGIVRLRRGAYDDDLRALRSRTLPSSAAGIWSRRLDAAFGRDRSGGFYVGVDSDEDVRRVVDALARADRSIVGHVDALPLVLPGTPDEQRRKIALVDGLRATAARVRPHVADGTDEAALLDEIVAAPPLRVLDARDLPAAVRARFTERDGRLGLLLAVHPAPGFDEWRLSSLARETALLARLELPDETRRHMTVAGGPLVFAALMDAVRRDGPRATAVAAVGVVALLVVALGARRELAATLVALALGAGGLLGAMALAGVRLNFLDFAALPITLGIGVDYPFNVAARAVEEGRPGGDPRGVARTGAAVLLCSTTTIIGYATLLGSDSGAVRSFGMAAALGELTCIAAALCVVPALVTAASRSRSRCR